jgi:hypothetical protein
MDQPSLFDYNKEPPAPQPVDLHRVRVTLAGNMRLLRNAITLPWSELNAEYWEERFPKLCALLPEEEGAPILAEFKEQMKRVWAEYHKYEARRAAS